jgi:putative hydrolase of the HAD superfamily
MPRLDIVAFDADDTLWQNERLYARAQSQLRQLLRAYLVDDQMDERLYQTEMRNLAHFGYGIKAFALSMIETAIELTDSKVSAQDISQIIEVARSMLDADVELLEQVAETIPALAARYRLMVITKGDLRDQESKIAHSGLGGHFHDVEIVSDKNIQTYREILRKHSTPAEHFLMVGNSLPSDILPVLELGGTAVYIPHELTWAHERAEIPPASQPGFHQLDHFGHLPALLEQVERVERG